MSNNQIPEAQASPNYDPNENLPEGIVVSVSRRNIGNVNSTTNSHQIANNSTTSSTATAPVVSPLSLARSLSSLSSTRNINPELFPNELNTRIFLTQNNWPMGYQNFLLRNVTRLPYRFFICDDSGSMSTSDGKRLVTTRQGIRVVKCTRWVELSESIKFHAKLAAAVSLPSEFRFLNRAEPIIIGGQSAHPEGPAILESLLGESPGGDTPLCSHIREVIAKVRELEPQLRALNQKASIIICTDGEASDGDLAETMAPLQHLPVWVVIRLCTDNDDIVQYWNRIDERLEVEIDVIDDMIGESGEVYSANPWVNYNEALHRMREFGVLMREMDLLDERLLSPDQCRAVCGLILGINENELPHPEAEFDAFVARVNELNAQSPKLYSLHLQRVLPLVDTSKIQLLYQPNRNSCVMC